MSISSIEEDYTIEFGQNEEKLACHHCSRLMELFAMRHAAITFQGSEVEAVLNGMRF